MRFARASIAALAAAAVAGSATASPLDKETCDKLKAEHATMTAAKDHLAKGPQWGKANLTRDQLKEVERYIHTEEQIAFRCVERKPVEAARPKAKQRVAKKAVSAENAEGSPAQAAGAAKSAVAAKAPQKAAKPADARAAVAEPVAGKVSPPVKKAAPKQKVNDAFVPPPASSVPAGGKQ